MSAPQRMTVDYPRDFVVFVIGMRVNKPWKVHKWLPVMLTMPRMLRELQARPESGFLGFQNLGRLTIIQYWRSFQDLEAYARSRDGEHWPAWMDFNKRIGGSGDVGVWHETYKIAAGEYEAIYRGVPAHGLGKVGRLVPAVGRMSEARGRLNRHAADRMADGFSGEPAISSRDQL